MPDRAADVIAEALTHHRLAKAYYSTLGQQAHVATCACGADNLRYGDRWEAHIADVTVAALTQAGHLGTQPVTVRTNYDREATWRAAALQVVAAWTTPPPGLPQLHGAAQEHLVTWWPSLAHAVQRLTRAKAQLLEDHE